MGVVCVLRTARELPVVHRPAYFVRTTLILPHPGHEYWQVLHITYLHFPHHGFRHCHSLHLLRLQIIQGYILSNFIIPPPHHVFLRFYPCKYIIRWRIDEENKKINYKTNNNTIGKTSTTTEASIATNNSYNTKATEKQINNKTKISSCS